MGKVANIKEANMYLAEDRILCLGIVGQPKKNYKLLYWPYAKATTDAVSDFIELLLQRRRWINSSWFALEYVLTHYTENINSSSHSSIMKNFSVPFNMILTKIGNYNAYFTTALYYFVLHSSAF
jgi:chitin synthase